MRSQFSIGKQQATKNYSKLDWNTPSVMFSEGMHPAGQFQVAPYLPLVRGKSKDVYTHVVISTGKVLALDSRGYVVPAGILDSDVEYTQLDVDEGVLMADGKPAEVGKKVKDVMTAESITVSNPIGLALFDFFRHPGGDGIQPGDFNFQNLNYQARVTFVCDYMVELPLVKDDATYEKAPLKGIAAFIAAEGANPTSGKLSEFTTVKPGDFVTFDKNSNMIVAAAGTDSAKVIGQVLQIVQPDPASMLKWVRTSAAGGDIKDRMPGSANGGVVDKISFSGGYGLVRVNLIHR